jgi:hypothetical protein
MYKKFKIVIQFLDSVYFGAKPSDTPSFCSFMNYADFRIGLASRAGMFGMCRNYGA